MSRITLEGYGQLDGERETAQLLRVDSDRIVLGFDDDGEVREVPFRKADGCAQGSTPVAGYRIPPRALNSIKSGKLIAGGKVNASNSSPIKTKGSAMKTKTPAKPGTSTKTPLSVVDGGKPASNGKAAKVTEETAPVTKTKTRASAAPPAAEPEPTKTTTRGRKAAEAAPPAPKTRGKVKASEETDETEETGELSPMQLEAARVKQPAEGEARIKVAPLMYRQLAWDEIRPFPEGRKVPGYRSFKAAMDKAAERSYVYMNVDEAAAKFLVTVAFKNGFVKNWSGSLLGGFKRAAKRIAEELAEEFGFELPAVIANHRGSSAEEEEEAPTPTRKGKPAPVAEVVTARGKRNVTPPAPPVTKRKVSPPAAAPVGKVKPKIKPRTSR